MATKLKNLRIKKVDFVDAGSNPEANILLYKNKEGEPASKKAADGSVVQKSGAYSFDDGIRARNQQMIADEVWSACCALSQSFDSIIRDGEITNRAEVMKTSLEQFYTAVAAAIPQWASGETDLIKKSQITEDSLSFLEYSRGRIEDMIAKVANETGNDGTDMKGEEIMVDKSKMTPAERAFYEDIEKRYSVADGAGAAEPTQPTTVANAQTVAPTTGTPAIPTVGTPTVAAGDAVAKALQALGLNTPSQVEPAQASDTNADDIYKGLHPAVRAEIEALRKFRQEAEDKEIRAVAKKYELIGKKEEELFPVLKSLKDAGGTAYSDMIAILDQTVDTVEKSGVFSEIGKAGHGNNEQSAEEKAIGIAKKYMAENPELSYHEAVAKAWEDNPALLAEYDEQAGF